MKIFSKLFYMGLLMIFMVSCTPMSKEKYMDRFASFIEEISLDYEGYSPENWAKMDEQFEKFTGEWYEKFEKEISLKEEIKIQGYKIKYAYYQTLSTGESLLNDIMNSIDVEGMKEEINNTTEDVKEAVEEFVEFINMDKEMIQKNIREIDEEVQKATEEVVETINSLAAEWEK